VREHFVVPRHLGEFALRYHMHQHFGRPTRWRLRDGRCSGLGPVVSQGAEGIAQFIPRTAHGLADPFRSKRCAIRRVICAN
jgi:hypothetical protein